MGSRSYRTGHLTFPPDRIEIKYKILILTVYPKTESEGLESEESVSVGLLNSPVWRALSGCELCACVVHAHTHYTVVGDRTRETPHRKFHRYSSILAIYFSFYSIVLTQFPRGFVFTDRSRVSLKVVLYSIVLIISFVLRLCKL